LLGLPYLKNASTAIELSEKAGESESLSLGVWFVVAQPFVFLAA
jgi:hypothetical protein